MNRVFVNKGKINPREIRQTYLDKMESDLSKKGVVFFDNSTCLNIQQDYLELPADITEVPSRDLGEHLNAFTQQKVYLRTLLGRVECSVEESRRAYTEASDQLYRKYSRDKMSETAKERIINETQEVKPFYLEYMDCLRKKSLVEYSIANVEDIIFLLSREVTRRSGDFADESRSYNVGRM